MSESSATRPIRRILLVEDDAKVRREIRRALCPTGHELVEAPTVAEAIAHLPSGFDLVLLDVRLPDGSGVDVAAAVSKTLPAPLIVALSGAASAEEAFGLAQYGVLQFMSKPFSVEHLLQVIEHVTDPNTRYEAIVKTFVGRQDLREVQESVRTTMVREALAMSGGNRSAAAKLLRVTRQAIQNFIRQGRKTR